MKKILSMVLVLLLSLSCFMMAGVSAEENTFTPSEEPIIYFEVPEDWGSYKRIFCCVFDWEEKEFLNGWQTKISRCTPIEGKDNLYSYDISVLSSFDEAKEYFVIFSADTGIQTYATLFSSECYGDTLYCDGTKLPHPVDHNKTAIMAYWKNKNHTEYGPLKHISDFGDVFGYSLPSHFTSEDLLSDFLAYPTKHTNCFWVVQSHTNKPDQLIIDDIAHQLGLNKTTVPRLVDNAGVHVQWKKADSTLPTLLGDANEDEVVNVKDSTIIQKYVAGYNINIDIGSADSDNNRTVNIKDATAIQKYIAGIWTYTSIGELFSDNAPIVPV